MTLPDRPAARQRQGAGAFTARVVATSDWDAPTPVHGWLARDVVRHLCEWFPAFLKAGAGVELARGADVDQDPVAAWRVHADSVQELLDDPATSGRLLRNPHLGELPLDTAVDRFYTCDVFMHTWDLARATGQDDRLESAVLHRVAGRNGRAGASDPVLRPVRRPGAGPGRRRSAGPADRLHRARPGVAGQVSGRSRTWEFAVRTPAAGGQPGWRHVESEDALAGSTSSGR